MTVSYTGDVATSNRWMFAKLLFRWKGSIYKVLYQDLVVYLILFASVSAVYRFQLNEEQKRKFEAAAMYCDRAVSYIPLSFVLGFYVSVLMTRWWSQFCAIPWPESVAIVVSANIIGQDDTGRLLRRTIMRYLMLAYVLTFMMVSPRVKKRFPTLQHLVDAGVMMEKEKNKVCQISERTKSLAYWVPLVWAVDAACKASKEERITSPVSLQNVVNSINDFRGSCNSILMYDWISMPLMYTQVVTWSVYSYFLVTVVSRQWLDPEQGYQNRSLDLYVPVFTLLQFFFYMGWLKVGETIINPFGEDDDDFEVNFLIDRNLSMSYLIVDEVYGDAPEMARDQHWEEVLPGELPYTTATEKFRRVLPPQGSAATITVSGPDAEYTALSEVIYGDSHYELIEPSDCQEKRMDQLFQKKGSWNHRAFLRAFYGGRRSDRDAPRHSARGSDYRPRPRAAARAPEEGGGSPASAIERSGPGGDDGTLVISSLLGSICDEVQHREASSLRKMRRD